MRRAGGLVALLLAGAAPLAGQRLSGWEAGIGALVSTARPAFAGGGARVGLRPGGGVRVEVVAAPGLRDDHLEFRGEFLVHYLVTPWRRGGPGFYAFGGPSLELGDGSQGWLVLGTGLEGSPGGASGWFLEAGIGGGLRAAAGWRWRRFGLKRQ